MLALLAPRGPSSLHASRVGVLTLYQGCLHHPCTFGSIRKLFLAVILTLSPASASTSLLSWWWLGQGLQVTSVLQEEAARERLLGSPRYEQSSAPLEVRYWGLPGHSSGPASSPATSCAQRKPVLCLVSSTHTAHWLWPGGS